MPSRILLSLSLLFLTLTGARAQTADDFFHGGALNYLSNNIPGALQTVTNGLQRFPDDANLKKLYELLNQQQQQDQKDQNQDQKQDQKQNQQKQDEQKQQQAKDDQQQKDREQKQKEAQDKKNQQQAKSDHKSKGKPDEKKETGKPQQVAAHAMTPQEAQQLLDAQKGDEQVLQFVPQGDPKNRSKRLKDW